MRKMKPFRLVKEGMTMKNRSSGISASWTIALRGSIEANNSSVGAVCWHGRTQSPLPVWHLINGEKRSLAVLHQLKRLTDRSFGSAASGLIMLDAIPENNKH